MHMGYEHEPEEHNGELALRHFGRAMDFLRAGNQAGAIKELERVLRYDPDFSEARIRLIELGGIRNDRH